MTGERTGSSAMKPPPQPECAPLMRSTVPSGRRIPSDIVCGPLGRESVGSYVGEGSLG